MDNDPNPPPGHLGHTYPFPMPFDAPGSQAQTSNGNATISPPAPQSRKRRLSADDETEAQRPINETHRERRRRIAFEVFEKNRAKNLKSNARSGGQSKAASTTKVTAATFSTPAVSKKQVVRLQPSSESLSLNKSQLSHRQTHRCLFQSQVRYKVLKTSLWRRSDRD